MDSHRKQLPRHGSIYLSPNPHAKESSDHQQRLSYQQRNPFQFSSKVNTIKQCIVEAQKISVDLLSIIEKINISSSKIKYPKYSSFTKQAQTKISDKFDDLNKHFQQLRAQVQQKIQQMSEAARQNMWQHNNNQSVNVMEITKTLENNQYEFLKDKMKGLQNSLQQTKKNQARLLQIIDKLVQKYEIPMNQPLNNQRNRLKTMITYNNLTIPEAQQSEEKGDPLNQQAQIDNKSIYHKLYQNNGSTAGDLDTINNQGYLNKQEQPTNTFRLRQLSQDFSQNDQVFIKKLYSRVPSNAGLNDSKISLRSELKSSSTSHSLNKHIESQKGSKGNVAGDKDRRMKFMISNLKT